MKDEFSHEFMNSVLVNNRLNTYLNHGPLKGIIKSLRHREKNRKNSVSQWLEVRSRGS